MPHGLLHGPKAAPLLPAFQVGGRCQVGERCRQLGFDLLVVTVNVLLDVLGPEVGTVRTRMLG